MIVKWNRIVLADNHDGGRMDPRDHQLIILLSSDQSIGGNEELCLICGFREEYSRIILIVIFPCNIILCTVCAHCTTITVVHPLSAYVLLQIINILSFCNDDDHDQLLRTRIITVLK